MKVMICQPMNGRTDEEIHNERNKAINALHKLHIDVVDNFFEDEVTDVNKVDIYLLSKSLLKMCEADAVLFIGKWREARGCRVEHLVAKDYGVKILYEDFIEEPKNETLRYTFDDKCKDLIVEEKDLVDGFNRGGSITITTPYDNISGLKPGDITYGPSNVTYHQTTREEYHGH